MPILNSSYDVTLSGAIPSAFAIMVTGLSDTVHNGLPLPAPLPGAPGCDLFLNLCVGFDEPEAAQDSGVICETACGHALA